MIQWPWPHFSSFFHVGIRNRPITARIPGNYTCIPNASLAPRSLPFQSRTRCVTGMEGCWCPLELNTWSTSLLNLSQFNVPYRELTTTPSNVEYKTAYGLSHPWAECDYPTYWKRILGKAGGRTSCQSMIYELSTT